jgi:flagellar hook assembly protein FlgD
MGAERFMLRIYDVSGPLARTLVDGHEASGTRAENWKGKNDQGQPMDSGI